MSPRRGWDATRIALLSLGGIAIVLAAAALAAALLFDPNAYKADIAAAVRRTTGRELSIGGPIRIVYGLRPRITADDLTLSNPPGFSQPAMARLHRAEASLSLRALLSGEVVVSRLLLVAPKILLERNSTGQGNWVFAPPLPRAATADAAPGAARTARPRRPAAVRALAVRDASVVWPGTSLLRGGTVEIAHLDATLDGGGETAHATASLLANGVAASADVAIGPSAAAPEAPWSVRATLASDAGRLAVSGSVRPIEGHGYVLALEAAVPDTMALEPILTRAPPALHDVVLTATARGDADGAPAWSDIRVHAGHWVPDTRGGPLLTIDRLDASAATALEPLRVDAEGRYRALALAVTGTIPSASALLRSEAASGLPFDLLARADDATAAAHGTATHVAGRVGLDATVNARVPDLAAIGAASGLPLPALRDAALASHVAVNGAGSSDGIALSGFTLASTQGDLAGEITVRTAGRPGVSARLNAARIDVDALRAAWPHNAGPPPPAVPAPGGAAGPAPAPAPAPAGPRLILSTRPLVLDALDVLEVDIDLHAASARVLGTEYADVSGHLVIADGRLALDRLTGHSAAGPLAASLTVEPTGDAPALAVVLHAPALAARAVLAAFGQPDVVDGVSALDMDLRAHGRSPHDMAASADGRIGLAMVDGMIDESLLARALGEAAASARATGAVADDRRAPLRCLAVGIDMEHGTATLATFVIDAGRVQVQATGTVSLADERLALRARPTLRAGGAGLNLPLRIGGTLAAPKVGIDAGAAAERLLFRRAPAPALLPTDSDPCPAALDAVRSGGTPMPVAPAPDVVR